MKTEKRAIKSDKLIVLFSETETAKQNQKFPFHFFFHFAAEGWGEEAREKCKEIFGFAPRESASVSEARSSASGAYALVPSHHALGACEVGSSKGDTLTAKKQMKIGLDFDGVISDCGKLKSDAAKKLH